METFTVEHDDQPHDSAFSAITAANKLLKDRGLELIIDEDGDVHDGWIVLEVKLKEI